MANIMDEFNKLHKLNISQDKTAHQYKSRSKAAKPQGDLKEEIYDLYYDVNDTITNSTTSNPNDAESNVYDIENVFDFCERNAPFLWVSNDGSDTLYVISLHSGESHSSRERPIYPGQVKTYKNVYELRLRSPTAGLPYRVSEYPICCNSASGTSSRGSALETPINISAAGDNTIIAAPAAGLRIRIVNMFLICSAAVAVTLKSGAATNLSGAMSFAANSGMGFNGDFNPLQCNLAQAFVINLGGNVQVSGFVLYYIE